MERELKSLSELAHFARAYIEALPYEEKHATVVGLFGDLGSGKTAFTKACALTLGIPEEILSPTFVIAKFYDIPKGKWKQLVHVDAYRIEDSLELRALKWESLLADPQNLVIIEWPENAGKFFPDNAHTLNFRFIDETTRGVR